MSKIRSSNTKPEIAFRSLLHRNGLRFRVHQKELQGKPDIVLAKYKVVIFVHGCFWHYHKECKEGRIPSSNSVFWKDKLEKNVARDIKHKQTLEERGWTVLTIWECEIEKEPLKVLNKVLSYLK